MYTVRAEGLNGMRLVREIARGDVRLYRLRMRPPRALSFGVRRKDLHKVVAILNAMCYNYSIKGSISEDGSLPRRLFLPVAALMMAVLVFCSDLFVWRVEVTGAEGVLAEDVRAVVAAERGGPGSFTWGVDEARLESALAALDGIAAASVSLKGSVLHVSVLEELSGEGVPPATEGDLVSGYDGVVTRVVAESGTPLVDAGDVVARGDTLITGDVYSTADGSVIGRTQVRGRVYAQVSFPFVLPLSEKTLVYTGATYRSVTVSAFGLEWGGGTPPFGISDSVTTERVLFPVPVTVRSTEWRELTWSETDDEGEAFVRDKGEELRALYGVDFAPRADVYDSGGARYMRVYFTAEICIGEI